jgi:hypothetical protein
MMLAENADSDRRAVLALLGFTPQQTSGLLAQGVTIDHLRGMLQLRRCEGAPVTVLADIVARIDRIAEFEKLPLDSLAA